MKRLLPTALLGAGLALLACAAGDDAPEVEVRVDALAVDPGSGSPVIILEESHGRRKLPIWIGISEARSIAARLEEEDPIRPNTHDLAKRLIDGLDGAVERVVVTELSESIYYAVIVVRTGSRTISVDARPSDAIAIALRTGSPSSFAKGCSSRRPAPPPSPRASASNSRRGHRRTTGKCRRGAFDSIRQSVRTRPSPTPRRSSSRAARLHQAARLRR